MKSYRSKIAPFVIEKLNEASIHRLNGDAALEFTRLEDAHVMGQESTYWHTKVHVEMMLWGFRNNAPKEIIGQLLRIVGALTKTALGYIPEGNTGGSNVSPFRPMPIRADLKETMRDARGGV